MTVTEIARMFADVAHVWEGRGVHAYEPGKPEECPVCEALDAILADDTSEREQEALQSFWENGLVFLANLAVFHPRGYALTVSVNDGRVERLFVQGDGDEPWVFGKDDVLEPLGRVLAFDGGKERAWQER